MLHRALPVALTLSLFLGWLVVGIVHHHADQPGCELCKALHNGVAQISDPTAAPGPRPTREAVSLSLPNVRAEGTLPLHRGRAPPLA